MSATVTVPATNAEVFEIYYNHIKFLIRKYGFHEELVEDMASILMLKFVEKEVLADYDPSHASTANFKTFLSGFVMSYLYHHMTRERRKRDIEAYSTDYSYTLDDGSMDLFIDQCPETYVSDEENIETLDLIIDIRKYLSENPKVMAKQTRAVKLEDFFSKVLEQVETQGSVNGKELAAFYGVSTTTISNWMKILRQHVEVVRG